MTRFLWLNIAFAFFTFSGCTQGTVPAPDQAEVKTTTPVEEDLKKADMEGMSQEDYLQGGKKE